MKSISDVLGQEFYKRHEPIFFWAKQEGIALCGSVAASVCRNKSDYVAPDIDFVTDDVNAIHGFTFELQNFLMERRSHFRFYFNCNNSFVPSKATVHLRITSGLWLPICLFLIKPNTLRTFRIGGGTIVQRLDDIKESADELSASDGKERAASVVGAIDKDEEDLFDIFEQEQQIKGSIKNQ